MLKVTSATVDETARAARGDIAVITSRSYDDASWAQGGIGASELGDAVEAREDAVLHSHLETELQALLILQFTHTGSSVMRTDLTRTDLLELCRRDIDPHRAPASHTKHLSKSTSHGQLAELNRKETNDDHRTQGTTEEAGNTRRTRANLHLRDLRYLQGVHDHHLMPRRGALVVSLGVLNVVITYRNAFFVVPDGADKLLQPLLGRLSTGLRNTESEMSFELRVLEAVLLTLITHHSESVERCLKDKRAIAEGIKTRMGSDMLTLIWNLKRVVSQVLDELKGCERAVADVQDDDEALALMYVSAMAEDPEAYLQLLRCREGNTEHVRLLLDAYVLEFHALSSQLHLVQKEIEATEDLLTLQLDVARNNLWKADILVGMAAMWLAVAMTVGRAARQHTHTHTHTHTRST